MVKRQHAARRRVTLQDLPPELLANIVDLVEQMHVEATERLAAGLAGVPGGLGGVGDDDPMGPGALWAALGGLMGAVGGGAQAGRAQAGGLPGAPPAAAAQQPVAANPLRPAANANANATANANTTPPLNPAAPAFTFGAAAPTPATQLDQAPPVSASPAGSFTLGAPANTTPAAGQGASPTTSPLGFNLNLPPFAPPPGTTGNSGNLSDDEMPPLETISDDDQPRASTSAIPAASTSTVARPSAPAATNSDDETPPLETISDDEPAPRPASTSTNAAQPSAASAPAAVASDDEMPPLEANSDDESSPRTSTSTSARPSSVPAPVATNSDDEMPPLETISDDEPSPPQASTSATTTAPDPPSPTVLPLPRSSSFDSMPPLETVNNPAQPSDGEQADAEDEDDDDYETEEDNEEDYDTYDDEDDYDQDEDSDDEAIFPDGLPLDPLLPLLYLSRPFLHTARKKLYRRITLVSVWQASLLLRSLKTPQHAARNAIEDAEDLLGEMNHLAALVRALNIDARGDMSIGRGGAEVYFELLNLCKNLEELRILPSLLKSATKPFLATLRTLTKLKKVDLASGTDPEKPFVLTTSRIIRLMRESWSELEELVVVGIKGSDFGPLSEQSIMWDDDNEEDDMEAYSKAMHGDSVSLDENRPKSKGLKTLKLLDPDAYEDELSLILKHSAESLVKLQISRPSQELSRWGLASIFLTYGANLTSVVLDCPATWQPMSRTTIKRTAFPYKPKDYKAGAPTPKDLEGLSRHTFFLDALAPYLPHIVDLTWTGPIASTSAFSFFPPSLKMIHWSRSPDIKPLALARLLRKSVTRSKVFTNTDGSKTTKQIQTIVSKGLECVTVVNDDLTWTDADLDALEGAAFERGMCLHLSGGTGAMPPGLGGLGALGGLGGLGAPLNFGPPAPPAPPAAGANAGAAAANGQGAGGAGAGAGGLFGGLFTGLGAGAAPNPRAAPAPATAANGGAAAGAAQGANGAANGGGWGAGVGLGGLAIPIALPFGFRPAPLRTG